MAERIKCEICQITFKDENGLMQHKQAKHPVVEKPQKINTKKIKNWTIIIVVIGLIIMGFGWLIYSTYQGINSCKTESAETMNIGGHTNLALHIHAALNIIIDGEKQAIPANIGILPGIMRPVHTHALDNEVHLEGPCQRDFTLRDFFAIWGRQFNSQCIFDKCTEGGILSMRVNGVDNQDFDSYIIKDDDDIVIEYKSN